MLTTMLSSPDEAGGQPPFLAAHDFPYPVLRYLLSNSISGNAQINGQTDDRHEVLLHTAPAAH